MYPLIHPIPRTQKQKMENSQ